MELKLSNYNLHFEIDPEDLDRVLSHSDKWSACFQRGKLSQIHCRSRLTGEVVILARVILGYYGPLQIDHIDRNPLNNKKSNFRLATPSQNNQNKSKKYNKHSAKFVSKYKGVSWMDYNKKWKVAITANKVRHYGGYFVNEHDAGRKANELIKECHGEFANLNVIVEDN